MTDRPIQELSRAWPILAALTIAYGCSSTLFMYSAHYFFMPIQAATGWTRAEIAAGMSLLLVTVSIGLPLGGILGDRYGVRTFALVSVVGYAAAVAMLALLPHGLVGYYLCMIIVGLFFPGTSVVPYSYVLAQHFVRLRGTALSVMLCGSAIVLTPLGPILAEQLQLSGWRTGYLILAGVSLFVGLPTIWFATRRTGAAATTTTATTTATTDAPTALEGLTLGAALKTATYWRLAVAVLASAIPLGGVLNQLSPILIAKGLPATEAAALGALYVFAVVGGRIVAGLLLDLLNPGLVAAGVMGIAALVLALFHISGASFLLSVTLVAASGLAMGAAGTLQGFFPSRLFGLAYYSSIFGTICMFLTAGLAVGPILFGAIFDIQGGYGLAIVISIGLYMVSALGFASLARVEPFRAAAPAA